MMLKLNLEAEKCMYQLLDIPIPNRSTIISIAKQLQNPPTSNLQARPPYGGISNHNVGQ